MLKVMSAKQLSEYWRILILTEKSSFSAGGALNSGLSIRVHSFRKWLGTVLRFSVTCIAEEINHMVGACVQQHLLSTLFGSNAICHLCKGVRRSCIPLLPPKLPQHESAQWPCSESMLLQGKGEFTMEYARHASIPSEKQSQLAATYRSSR